MKLNQITISKMVIMGNNSFTKLPQYGNILTLKRLRMERSHLRSRALGKAKDVISDSKNQ